MEETCCCINVNKKKRSRNQIGVSEAIWGVSFLKPPRTPDPLPFLPPEPTNPQKKPTNPPKKN